MGQGAGSHAVVLGGSMAGIMAARVLAEHYERVTVLERDRVPAPGTHRRGVPQGRHVHVLLTGGKRVIDEWFPDASQQLVARGGLVGEASRDLTLVLGGGRIRKVEAGLDVLSVSRPMLEGHLRTRLLELPQVSLVEGCEAHGLTASADGRRVTGVRVLRRDDGSAEEVIACDLVVDATGRGSRTPVWLASLGHERPRETELPVKVAYTSCRYPRRPEDREHAVVVGARPPGRRVGAAHAAEDDTWIVTLTGLAGEQAPTDVPGFVDYAATLAVPDIHELIRDRAPLTDPVVMRHPGSIRRRYEELERLPEGLLVTGDAWCSFNPIYGQGMTVAAMQASVLADCLAEGTDGLGPRFFVAARGVVDFAWSMAAGADRKYLDGQRRPSVGGRVMNGYLERLLAAATHDPVVATAFLRVNAMVAQPRTLLRPGVVARVAAASFGPGRSREGRRGPDGDVTREPVPGADRASAT